MLEDVLSCLSLRIKEALIKVPPTSRNDTEEIRIRIGRPVELIIRNRSYFLLENGRLSSQYTQGMIANAEDGHKMMNLISRHSVYAIEEELRRGYITLRGGHRVGIAGRAVVEDGKVKFLKDIQSFNIRIAREVLGIAQPILPKLFKHQRFLNTLIISPPKCGKTTLLRDLVRALSYGQTKGSVGYKVGIVDERSEIASCMEGVPQNDLGPRVDVLDACPKAEGMMMLIRSMSPDIVACDEIGSEQDVTAILEAINAGVSILTTVHGSTLADIKRRPALFALFKAPVFERYVILSNRLGLGSLEAILNQEERIVAHAAGGIKHA